MITPGVLFDMDGVIVHTNPFHKEAIQRFCADHGLSASEDFLRKHVYGRTNKEWIPEVFGRALSSKELAQYADEKESLFRELFLPHLSEVAGFTEFIDRLISQNINLAVATSAPCENAEFILRGLGIYDRFDAVLDSSHVDNGKPDPEVYLKAARALGLPADQCIVFEDSLAGVRAGLAAGCKVVGVTTTHTVEELSACHLQTSDFGGLTADDLRSLF